MKSSLPAKRRVVRQFELRIRRPKDLRVCNIATVLGRGARRWRELPTKSVLPAAILPAVSTGLSY